MGLHRNSPYTENHAIYSLSYVDAAARLAAVLLISDIGRIARQEDDGSFWILRNHSPMSWTSITAGGAAAGGEPTQIQNVAAAAGISGNFSREDHVHSVETATAIGLTVGGSSSAGSGTALALADHIHALAGFGTAAGTFCQGNDARLSDSRSPNGAAGGQLGSSYPNPDVRGIRETGTPQLLTFGAIADGQRLTRSGTTVIGVTPSVFGAHIFTAISAALLTTTLATFQDKTGALISTGNIPGGTYLLIWSYMWAYSGGTTNFEARVLQDGVTELGLQIQEPQDTSLAIRQPATFMIPVVFGSPGSHTFQLQWRAASAGNTAQISDAYMVLIRLS